MNKNDYDSYIKDFKERGVDIALIRKVIFQKHENATDEAMKVALKPYYEISKQQDISEQQYLYTTKLSVVLYELKEENSDKLDGFCRSFL